MTNDLHYGPVVFLKGEYKGRIGLYDDDDESRKRSHCIVLLQFSFAGEYTYERPENLRNISSIEFERAKKKNPKLWKMAGY